MVSLKKKPKKIVYTISPQRFKAIAICICFQSSKKIILNLEILYTLAYKISWDLQDFSYDDFFL